MGKAKKIGIVIGITILVFVIVPIVVGSNFMEENPQSLQPQTSSYKYSVELSDKEKSNVRIIQESCDTQSELASLTNEEAGKIFKQKCQESVDAMEEGFKKPKVIKLAIDNHDVKACNLLKKIDGCVIAYVEEFKEIEACNVLDSKYECVTNFAVKFKEPTACSSLDDNTSCFSNYSITFYEPELCLQASDPQSCLEILVPKIGATVCNLMSVDKIENCKRNYLSKPLFLDNYDSKYSECLKDLTSGVLQNGCHLKTVNLNGITTNELLNWKTDGKLIACKISGAHGAWDDSEESLEDFCIAGYGVALNDLSLCDMAGKSRGECYGAIAWNDNSVTLKTCDMLAEEGAIAFCYYNVAGRTKDRLICENDSFPSLYSYFNSNCNIFVDKRLQWEKTHLQ